MHHRAIDIKFKEGTVIEATFQDGLVKQYDVATLFDYYPPLKALQDRELFTSGYIVGGYGVLWTNDLDLDMEEIYQEGVTVRRTAPAPFVALGESVMAARAEKGITQKELGELAGIDQSDISKIERGIANPSMSTLDRIAKALGAELHVTIV